MVLQGEHALGPSSKGVLIHFLMAGISGQVSGEGLSRIFISFPSMSFNMLIHQNECIVSSSKNVTEEGQSEVSLPQPCAVWNI